MVSHMLRYYQNDGTGKLVRWNQDVPQTIGNFSCIVAEDFDQDGDEDLFIGGRAVPGNYGLRPRSFLLRNDQEQWTDITPDSLAGGGMVTGAVWSDFDGDAKKDLIVVGEWMPIRICRNTGKALDTPVGLPNTEGWWTSIDKNDLDNDGKEDLIAGNWGLNSKFKASAQKPLTMYVKDFDQNGKSEFIINWYPPAEDKSYPFASKMDMTAQLPMLKKNSIKYEDYARKDYEALLSPEHRKGADMYKATYLQSAIVWNRGNSGYKIEALPMEAQVSPVFSIVVDDFDGDNNKDIFLGRNFYGLKPEVGRHDSSNGLILKGDGKGQFIPLPKNKSGINISGEIRDVTMIYSGNSKKILIGRNNASAVMLEIKK
jgi:hypothetical protein